MGREFCVAFKGAVGQHPTPNKRALVPADYHKDLAALHHCSTVSVGQLVCWLYRAAFLETVYSNGNRFCSMVVIVHWEPWYNINQSCIQRTKVVPLTVLFGLLQSNGFQLLIVYRCSFNFVAQDRGLWCHGSSTHPQAPGPHTCLPYRWSHKGRNVP